MSSYTIAVNKFVNDTFGSDIKNLQKIEKIYADVLKKKENLEKQLSIVADDAPTTIEASIDAARSSLDEAEELQQEQVRVEKDVSDYLDKTKFAEEKYEKSMSEIKAVEKCQIYLRWVAKIEDTSAGIQQSILSDSIKEACQTFKILTGFSSEFVSKDTRCRNLLAYLTRTIMFWYKILTEKLSSELEVLMKQIGWPFVSNPGPHKLLKTHDSSEKSTPSPFTTPDPAVNLDKIFGSLLCIELPKHLRDTMNKEVKENGGVAMETDSNFPATDITEDPLTEDEPDFIPLPFQLLLRPLVKRFGYHFTGKKETNSIHKPEWYLSQVLKWIGNHVGFLENTIQPILDDHNFEHVDALLMFTQGLLKLVNDKLSLDMMEVIEMDELFIHTVDEVLLFHRELKLAYTIPDTMLKRYSPMNILTQPQCLIKWLNIEKTAAVERLDTLLSAEDAWHSKYEDSDDSDEMKTPSCAESFVSLLLTITDRYKSLSNNVAQLKFLDLQLLLLDDFRIRLTQMLRSIGRNQFDEARFAILNAAYYITLVLQEWADNVFFLQLKYHKDQLETPLGEFAFSRLQNEENMQVQETSPERDQSTDETVFESTINLFERICSEGVKDFVQVVATEFGLKSHAYSYDDWPTMPPAVEQEAMLVSRTACPMLELIQDRLFLFEESLCQTLFHRVWHEIAEYIDDHLFKEVVMKNRFNEGGAYQLQFDMNRNLFPLFRTYSTKPENYFKRMKESCLLLNLQRGSALLLMELLSEETDKELASKNADNVSDPVRALSDMGIYLIRPKDAARVLKRRIDWTS
uniref:RAD50-interacting protein 1 n=1 Tax=Phallusia mammillata TaxID=59560 RepID=A0A6F9DRG3_9ASCI|nr:RAD50-interacting protein 1-like [Phallusia mammillata]